jgi:hypothetical protein
MRRFAFAAALLLTAVGLATAALGQQAVEFGADLTGAQEVPPVTTNATGAVKVTANAARTELAFELEVRNGTRMLAAAGAHFHCAPQGQNGPVIIFMAGELSGGLNGRFEVKGTLTQANITNTACGATLAEVVQAMQQGRVYANVHSTANPGGEIRGQLRAR